MSRHDLAPLPDHVIHDAVATALREDFGLAGDITSVATIPPDQIAEASIVAREPGVIAGLAVAQAVFHAVDRDVRFAAMAEEGQRVEAGTVLAHVVGAARSLLAGERVALNFVGRMSGIATLTAQYVAAVEGTGARITCTRKTTPGHRALEKYAVRAGGGVNHRFGLFDGILIKDNHVTAAGGLMPAIERARAAAGHMVRIEVEVETLDQLDQALGAGVDAILLDNMTPDELREAVQRAGGSVSLEASGGVSLDTVAGIAATGVDLISAGAVTHSAPCLDVSLDFAPRDR